MKPLNHPFYMVAKQFAAMIDAGHTVHQKFTCAKCGSRQTMEQPNLMFKTGRCEECGHVTNIEKDGCNFLLSIERKHNAGRRH